ncbi:class I SAM-dependent methyltransferase [Nocardia stercoris]|uniref:S-adenosyl-L-methionine-dependent methyltransferase n=1 Tax=Nocardia stercoris TaxID=2483361 RepID=A0A3M2L7A0_9NOCA|nr:SAM-dependent methyltransferase [Nocardia stercoris]RMI32610.1 SAM-dependent methyltransferase [Nocardia stercoris]
MTSPAIGHVSETARWVAVYRALESARPDALFHDELAAVLAGEQGRELARSGMLPLGARDHWPTVVRTRLLDDLILDTLAQGCDRVINLAAGLDTRPFRLALPAELRWYEVDLPESVAYKQSRLAGRKAACEWIARPLDVTDAAATADFLAEATAGARAPLVLTEGLLPYLRAPQVATLSGLLRAAGTRWWALDHWSPAMLRLVNLTMGSELGSARWTFAATLGSFRDWRVETARSTFRAAARWERSPLPLRGSALLPEVAPGPRLDRSLLWCGAVRMTPRGDGVAG